jgi:protein TonB
MTIRWEERPNAQDFARHFPEQALMRGISGSVVLDCIVNAEHRLNCQVASEVPTGHGFGRAALRVAERFRISAQTQTGASTVGGRVRVPIRMNVAN